jgi:CheY-like chemotaxis protein
MGGRIGVRSTLGIGSTFWFTVEVGRRADAGLGAPGILGGRRILIVDGPSRARSVAHELERFGAVCVVAASLAEAMAELHAHAGAGRPFDAAIIADDLEGTSGQELAVVIKAHEHLATTRLVRATIVGRKAPAGRSRPAAIELEIRQPIRRDALIRSIVALFGEPAAPLFAARTGPAPAAAGETAAVPTASRRILVVEDNIVNQKVALALLGRMGHRVDVAANGLEAVAAVAVGRYDIVLMDCQMPEMDGFEASQAIRRAEAGTGRRLPIVAMTANAMTEDRDRCLAAGMDDHIAKPIRRDILAATLETWLQARPNETGAADPVGVGSDRDGPLAAASRLVA